jgi:hypothetical protein
MRYCVAGEYQSVGGDSMAAVMSGQTGTLLVRMHAVRMLPGGPAGTAACGYVYGPGSLRSEAWDQRLSATRNLLCEPCFSEAGFGQ